MCGSVELLLRERLLQAQAVSEVYTYLDLFLAIYSDPDIYQVLAFFSSVCSLTRVYFIFKNTLKTTKEGEGVLRLAPKQRIGLQWSLILHAVLKLPTTTTSLCYPWLSLGVKINVYFKALP